MSSLHVSDEGALTAAMLPLGIIAGTLCVMGASQHFIHKAAYGRPKHVRSDKWDVAMDRRDRSLMEAAASMKQSMAN
jgi:NADH dehydrogenase (ubiquinone) 1 alpha subcomplex subunit 1